MRGVRRQAERSPLRPTGKLLRRTLVIRSLWMKGGRDMSFVETTEVLGNIGDLIGAVAVVLSLIYLAIQIRRNTEALQLSASESISRSVVDFNRIPIESDEMNEIYLRGASDPSSLTRGERNRF